MIVHKTSGGHIDISGGKIVSAWCAACKSGGRPCVRDGQAWCWCGRVIARTNEIDSAIEATESAKGGG